jgi:hypothetical protein
VLVVVGGTTATFEGLHSRGQKKATAAFSYSASEDAEYVKIANWRYTLKVYLNKPKRGAVGQYHHVPASAVKLALKRADALLAWGIPPEYLEAPMLWVAVLKAF